MGRTLWLGFVVATAFCGCDAARVTAQEQSAEAPAWPRGRLAGTAVPTRYTLHLTVVPERERFSGTARIDVTLREPASGLFLHGDGLRVTRASVRTESGENLAARYQQLSPEGVAQVSFGRELAAQALALEFDYDAPFDRRLNGLYRVDEDERSYAFTQFQSTFARKAFPSFDEPAHKVPFRITLRVRDGQVAIANTPLVETRAAGDGLVDWVFAPSEPMPTYLVAFAVGALAVVQGADIPPNEVRSRPVPLRGVAAHGKGDKLAHALATTGEILTALERYFDLPYPYAKLDIIAVPDFQAGAMENAGAITFRERLLLLGDDAPLTQVRSYTSVMAHELAHMWFGDLVTMPWWDDIWLNEAFATWMSYKAVAEVAPEQRPQLRRLGRLRFAKTEDALASARQVREPVVSHDDIDQAFDSITYAKGAAVLAMFENYLGAETFRAGVRAHVKRYAWGSADVDDFIASLVGVSEPRIAPGFRSFLFQNGLPKIRIDSPCQDGALSLSQSRYKPLGGRFDGERRWQFPVCLRYGDDDRTRRQCAWMAPDGARVEFETGRCPDWLMLDADFAGYYHWGMGAREYAALTSTAPALTAEEWQSVADSVEANLADGALSVAEAWRSLAPLARSRFPAVARAPTRMLDYLLEHYGDEPKIAAALRHEALALYGALASERALDKSFLASLASDEERLFHARLLEFMALRVQDETARKAAYAAFTEAATDTGIDTLRLPSLTLRTALAVAARDGDAPARQAILQAFLASRDSQFRRDALEALALVRDPAFAQRLRALTLDGSLRSNEIAILLNAQFKDANNRVAAWRWLRENWDALAPTMPVRNAARAPRLAAYFCDIAVAGQAEALFAPGASRYPGTRRALDKAVEAIGNCARRVALERPGVRAAFSPGPRR